MSSSPAVYEHMFIASQDAAANWHVDGLVRAGGMPPVYFPHLDPPAIRTPGLGVTLFLLFTNMLLTSPSTDTQQHLHDHGLRN
ncbi:hypothetical protein SPI_00815 [Niveomyces insectorum RCEF 264]|uniref:Uncharacterized protein n=1 Tax=Niveomyces insectorum RCEF 264 TaxID=1081102 RepID=A0A168ADX7_9HYPO|nr:hypothetical protein SPI_00815 [Niveomyces insectorum RCEF 264]